MRFCHSSRSNKQITQGAAVRVYLPSQCMLRTFHFALTNIPFAYKLGKVVLDKTFLLLDRVTMEGGASVSNGAHHTR